MIDIHTHILPGIDDGSNDVEETSLLLDYMAKTGVKTVVATPHYYHNTSIDEFIAKRNEAYLSVKKIKPAPEIKLGAEVLLEYGIHQQPDLKKLCIEGTDYMLVELPYSKWDDWVYDELFKISLKNINVIIAHIDRYTEYDGEKSIHKLLKLGMKLQGNVDNVGGFFRHSVVTKLMKKDVISFVGSDCHNMTTRMPCMDKAVKKLSQKFGKKYVSILMNNAEKMLNNETF